MNGQASKTTGTITLCLAAVLVISFLPASLAAAQSPEICAPVERTCSISSPLTVPSVPTGMKAGISTGPCGV